MKLLKNQPPPSPMPLQQMKKKKTLTSPFTSPLNNEKKVLRKIMNPPPFPVHKSNEREKN
jgi:hypothetical protein